MIRSFKDIETRKLFNRERSTKLPADIQGIAYRKLAMLHSANALINLQSPPGDRAGQFSIRINNQWRICFEWRDEEAWNVS